MPNKEKSVKSVPKSNGNDEHRTQSTIDVNASDVKKGANNKKREKHKNKEMTKSNHIENVTNVTENGTNSTATETNNDEQIDPEIRAVSEELLRRLKCNGTSITVRKTDNTAQQISSNVGDNGVKPQQQKLKQLNNNNNNSKAHNKNCQNQKHSAKNVNISSNNVEISSDKTVQCNGTHSESSVDNCHTANKTIIDNSNQRPGTSKNSDNDMKPHNSSESQSQTDMTSKEIVHESSSTFSSQPHQQQHHHHQQSNLPSTSAAMQNECTVSSLPNSALSVKSIKTPTVEVTFKEYENELQMPDIMRVIQRELSEPYSIYTYRYFIHNWPKLCFLAMDGDTCIGAIVCKLDIHRQMTKRGYIAMLAVDAAYRKFKVGTTLVQKAIEAMLEHNADEVVLETEITNIPALRLYERLGFVRDKRLFDYYLNGVDALRLKLWFK